MKCNVNSGETLGRPSGSRTARLPARALCFAAVRVGDRLLHCRSSVVHKRSRMGETPHKAVSPKGETSRGFSFARPPRCAPPCRPAIRFCRGKTLMSACERASTSLLSRKNFALSRSVVFPLINPIIREVYFALRQLKVVRYLALL